MRALKIAILIFLLAWYGLFLFHKIDLTTSDLGRHIKNGELILGHPMSFWTSDVLFTNFYSYTEPDYPFTNHHWLSGVVFYLIWKISGFIGVHLFFILLSLIAFWLFFDVARKIAGYTIASPVAIFLIPLIAERVEVRPEVFSYLFAGLFFWILWNQYYQGPASIGGPWGLDLAWALPLLMLFWANLHSYFFFGFFILLLFCIVNRALWKFFAVSLATALANPFGYKIFLLPLDFFKNYGYRIIENQSVGFLDNLGFIQNPNLFWFKIVFAVLTLTLLAALFIKRKEFNWVVALPAALLAIASALVIRNFTIFGFFALPALASSLKSLLAAKFKENKETIYGVAAIFSALILTITIFSHQIRLFGNPNGFGIGIAKANEASAEFFKQEKISGPVFNNYDIGSYLIFHLFPKEKVFTDNRPEAYSSAFFENVYAPMQQDEKIWTEQEKKYGFNAIFFSHRDATPWGQKFLAERIKDTTWKLVYLDNYAIIFTKVKP